MIPFKVTVTMMPHLSGPVPLNFGLKLSLLNVRIVSGEILDLTWKCKAVLTAVPQTVAIRPQGDVQKNMGKTCKTFLVAQKI